MSDTDNDKPKLGMRQPLGLKRTVETGKVKQSFSHGRSNTVVEVKRRRVLGRMPVDRRGAGRRSARASPGARSRGRHRAVDCSCRRRNARFAQAEEQRMGTLEDARRREDAQRQAAVEDEKRRVEEEQAWPRPPAPRRLPLPCCHASPAAAPAAQRRLARLGSSPRTAPALCSST